MDDPNALIYTYCGVPVSFLNYQKDPMDTCVLGMVTSGLDVCTAGVWQVSSIDLYHKLGKLHIFLENQSKSKNQWSWGGVPKEYMNELWNINEQYVEDPRMRARFILYVRAEEDKKNKYQCPDPSKYSKQRKDFDQAVKKFTRSCRQKLHDQLKANKVGFTVDKDYVLNLLAGHFKIACFAQHRRFWSHIEIIPDGHGGKCWALVFKDGQQLRFSVNKSKHQRKNTSLSKLFRAKQERLVKDCLHVSPKDENSWNLFLTKRLDAELQAVLANNSEIITKVRKKYKEWNSKPKNRGFSVKAQQQLVQPV